MNKLLRLMSILFLSAMIITVVPAGSYTGSVMADGVSGTSIQVDPPTNPPADPTTRSQIIDALRNAGPAGSQLADLANRFMSTGGTIRFSEFGELPSGASGGTAVLPPEGPSIINPETNRSQGSIILHYLFQTLPPEAGASVLAHELAHLTVISALGNEVSNLIEEAGVQGAIGAFGTPGDCFNTEVLGLGVGAFVWEALGGPNMSLAGLSPNQQFIVAGLNDDVQLWSELRQVLLAGPPTTPAQEQTARDVFTRFLEDVFTRYHEECTQLPEAIQRELVPATP